MKPTFAKLFAARLPYLDGWLRFMTYYVWDDEEYCWIRIPDTYRELFL